MNHERRASALIPCAKHRGWTGRGLRKRLQGRTFAALFCVLTLSACGNIEPWVKPYERQNLADPVMAFELNPISASYMDHVYEAREGARGALGGGGGGCGCN